MVRKNIRCHSMLGTSHSWAVTMRNLLLSLNGLGCKLYLKSINGYDLVPDSLKKNISNIGAPDIDIAYTLPRNFKQRFLSSSKLKLAIYNYETSLLPEVWRGEHRHIDYALPSSNFSKKVFVDSGWPEEKCIVVPHGINLEEFNNKRKINLGNNKKFRFLNISIPHYRKNLDILLDAYYSEFTSNDDVCLVLKTSLKKPKNYFEANVARQINQIQSKYKGRLDLPQVEIIQKRFESIVPLYNSCDALVSASSSEGFGLPLLEGLAAGMVVISPRCSGQLDFLNDKNSILYKTKIVKADKRYQYWNYTDGAETFMPIKEELASSMRSAFVNHKILLSKFKAESENISKKYTWDNAARKILEINK